MSGVSSLGLGLGPSLWGPVHIIAAAGQLSCVHELGATRAGSPAKKNWRRIVIQAADFDLVSSLCALAGPGRARQLLRFFFFFASIYVRPGYRTPRRTSRIFT
jgi:hypothetical protein